MSLALNWIEIEPSPRTNHLLVESTVVESWKWGNRPDGVQNMLRVRVHVCATKMDGFLGPKFSTQGSPFHRFSLSKSGLSKIGEK